MSLLEQQNFLARLYTDENLRKRFLSAPEKIGKENNLDEKEIAELAAVLPEELNFFADSLFWKRLREVEKMLPLTRKFFAENFESYFREFSQSYQPNSVKKHLEDAIEFVNFINKREKEDVWIKDLARFEQAKLEFNACGKNFVFRVFDFDVKGIHRTDAEAQSFKLKKKKTLAVWLRIGKKVKHFVI
ncbi:MAG TPA: hypothetical protein VK892_18260 [Pyrinomonadaceae bacterium]|nr:hypothetical protein [Pyrinomonadaceae bacterium]